MRRDMVKDHPFALFNFWTPPLEDNKLKIQSNELDKAGNKFGDLLLYHHEVSFITMVKGGKCVVVNANFVLKLCQWR